MGPSTVVPELPRSKAPNLIAALIYRTARLLARLVGKRRVLGWMLDVSWMSRRVAFELAVEHFGEAHHNAMTGFARESLSLLLRDARRVVDVGCGYGRLSRAIAPHVEFVLGVDVDQTAIAAARESSHPPNVSFEFRDVTDSLDGLDQFDVGILSHVLEHLDDPGSVLSSLRSVCHRLLIEVPDFDADPLNLARLKLGRDFYTDADHVREYTEETLRQQLGDTGWRVGQVHRRGGALLVETLPRS